MRDPNRIPGILKEIEKIWNNNPDLRLAQPINNLGGTVYFYEDDALIKSLKELYDSPDPE